MLAVLHEYRYALHDVLAAAPGHTEQADMRAGAVLRTISGSK